MEPSSHQRYKEGDSWVEELGLTAQEFRTAFDRIGIRHKSKGQFDEEQDKFQGKFYASYLDRRENLTYYFRNNSLVDDALDTLIFDNKQNITVNNEKRFTVNQESRFTVNHVSQSLEIGKVNLQEIEKHHLLYTENTNTKNTHIPLLPNTGCSSADLIFPKQLSIEEIPAITTLIKHLHVSTQQELLAELEGALRSDAIRRTPLAFIRGLVAKEKKDLFTLDLGVSVMKSRIKKTKELDPAKSVHEKEDPVARKSGEQLLKKVRTKLEKSSVPLKRHPISTTQTELSQT